MFSFISNMSYTLKVVTVGVAILGFISGIMGSLTMLKKQSLAADMISHASLPGIVMIFMITGLKTKYVFMCGAAFAGFVAVSQMYYLVKKHNHKQDGMLSLFLSVYFAFGMVLLTYVYHKPEGAQSGIETFLFGQAATMLMEDVVAIAIIGVIILIILLVFRNQFLLLIFDSEYMHTMGYSLVLFETLFSFLLVLSVIIGLQAVGIILMSAMLIAPGVAARQWTNNIYIMLILAAIFGGVSGIVGSVLSSSQANLPTGPLIIITISVIVIASILFAPKRGLLFRYRRLKLSLPKADPLIILEVIYSIIMDSGDRRKMITFENVSALYPYVRDIDEAFKILADKGFIYKVDVNYWELTDLGYSIASSSCDIKDRRCV